MRAITLLVFAIALCKVYALDQPNYAVPWWAAAYDSSRVNQLVQPSTLANGQASAPASSANTEAVYAAYQGGAYGSVMLETGAEAQEEEQEEEDSHVDLSGKMHSLIALDSALESPTVHVPTMEIFTGAKYEPVLQKGAVFHATVLQTNGTRNIVDEVLFNGEREYGFSKMPLSFKSTEDAKITLQKHNDDMAGLKEDLNFYESYYWNNGGLNVPEHITGGSFMEVAKRGKDQVEEDFHGVLSELESALDSEKIEEKMMQAGMNEANAEEVDEMKSFIAIQDAMTAAEDAQEVEQEEEEEEGEGVSFMETQNVNRDISEHMLPIPVAVKDYVERQALKNSMKNFHGVPIVTVKHLGSGNVLNSTAGTWDVHVGPAPATVVDNIITKAFKNPKVLDLTYRTIANATETHTQAGITLKERRAEIHIPMGDIGTHSDVIADLKPLPLRNVGADGLIDVRVAK